MPTVPLFTPAASSAAQAHNPEEELTLTATLEPWRTVHRELIGPDEHSAYGLPGKGGPRVYVEPDTIVSGRADSTLPLGVG